MEIELISSNLGYLPFFPQSFDTMKQEAQRRPSEDLNTAHYPQYIEGFVLRDLGHIEG